MRRHGKARGASSPRRDCLRHAQHDSIRLTSLAGRVASRLPGVGLLVDDRPNGCDAAPATWTATERFINYEGSAWACPAGQGRSYIRVANDITGTNDHRGTMQKTKGSRKKGSLTRCLIVRKTRMVLYKHSKWQRRFRRFSDTRNHNLTVSCNLTVIRRGGSGAAMKACVRSLYGVPGRLKHARSGCQ